MPRISQKPDPLDFVVEKQAEGIDVEIVKLKAEADSLAKEIEGLTGRLAPEEK